MCIAAAMCWRMKSSREATRTRRLQMQSMSVTRHYETPFTEHVFMEPECAIADFDRNENKATIWSSDQGVYTTQHECALMLGLPAEQVHVVNALVGGGFGGKEDIRYSTMQRSWLT